MTSKRSFIKIQREDMKRRIWPLALSIVGFFFALPVLALIKIEDHISSLEEGLDTLESLRRSFVQYTLAENNGFMVAGICIMALINAMHGMKYLHSKQESDFYGSIPVLRTQKFTAAYLNGILITAIPLVVMHLFAALLGISKGLVTAGGFGMGVQTVVILLCAYMLIYTVIVLAAVLTGHGAVTVAAATVLMFIVLAYAGLVESYASAFFITKYDTFFDENALYLSPVTMLGLLLWHESSKSEGWIYSYSTRCFVLAAIILVISLALFFAIRAIVKIRPAESAGKAMAFEKTKAVIKIIIMVPVALAFGLLFPSISSSGTYRWMIFGLIVGAILAHATIEIIYEFDFKACVKHLISGALGAAVTAVIVCLFVFDPLGYDTGLPDRGSVESAALYVPGINSGAYYVDYGYNDYLSNEDRIMTKMLLRDTDSVYTLAEQGRDFARANRMRMATPDGGCISEFDEADSSYRPISVNLRLRSGREFRRTYYIDIDDKDIYTALSNIYDTAAYKNEEYFLLSSERKPAASDIQFITYESGYYYTKDIHLNAGETKKLLDTLAADTRTLTLDVLSKEAPIGVINLNVNESKPNRRGTYSMEIGYVYPSFKKTRALLESYGIDDGSELHSEDVDYILAMKWSDDGEDLSERIESRAEIDKLVPDLVMDRFSDVNSTVFEVSRDINYEVHFKGSNGSSENYVLRVR
jgi:hypothetical protein